MRKNLSFLLCLLSLSAFGADNKRKTSSIPPKSGNSAVYVDKDKGFSIALPSGWQQDKDIMGTAVMALSKADGTNDGFRENINVVVENLQGPLASKAYFEASQNAIKKVFQGFKLEQTGKTKISGRELYWSIFSHQTQTPQLRAKVLQYVTVNGQKAFIITCSASSKDFDQYRKTFENSAKTFKVQ